MKKIKSKRNFITGIIATIIAAVCLLVLPLNGFEKRFLVADIILIGYAITNFALAFSRKGFLEKVNRNIDERDIYISMKSGHMTLKILNYILITGSFASLILYEAIKNYIFVTVAITLCSLLIVLFIVILCVNIYYEKHK